jgi:hypothetical protein
MAVYRNEDAFAALRQRLGPPPPEGGSYVARPVPDGPPMGTFVPEGFGVERPDDWLWDESVPVPPLRHPEAYRAGSTDALLAQSPDILSDRRLSPAEREAYCRASADVTMKGGTTSGVVYPLAICEVARIFRLRNVGGASAGAIAAGMAAAAETGRLAHNENLAETCRRDGHVRAGFPGLADAVAWLSQADDSSDGVPDEQHRLAGLFRPGRRTRSLYRVVQAVLLKQAPLLPFLLVRAAGPLSMLVVVVVLVGTLVVVAASRTGRGDDIGSLALSALLAAVALVSVVAALLGAARVCSLLGAFGRRPRGESEDPVIRLPAPRRGTRVLAVAGTLVAAGVAVITIREGALAWPTVVFGGPAATFVVVLAVAAGWWRRLRSAQDVGFGMIPGAEVAGASNDSGRELMTWISDTLSELAGLRDGDVSAPLTPSQVLRFGHLWFGRSYQPGSGDLKVLRVAAREASRRRVNLELMTTELVQSRAYRFPLPPAEEMVERDGSALYLNVADFADPDRDHVVPAAVREVVLGGVRERMTDIRTRCPVTLVPLPEPWDLPVVFAMRLSMSLPGIFQAVRLYREVPRESKVRDEFGRPVVRGGEPVVYPVPGEITTQKVCEELWFTDGGVTSNFPIHFFDSPLPRWPTFGINLGTHPPGFKSQDVWLPQDWDTKLAPPRALEPSMASFLAAVVATARQWRDTEQTFMPGFRGRIAWVRERADEGGLNLYMANATIASLALRGVVAGARLRRRFGATEYWRRNQWIRLRSTLGNLEELGAGLRAGRVVTPYRYLSNPTRARSWFVQMVSSRFPGDPRTPRDAKDPDPWFSPRDRSFWTSARRVLAAVPEIPKGSLTSGVPKPESELRQVPPV